MVPWFTKALIGAYEEIVSVLMRGNQFYDECQWKEMKLNKEYGSYLIVADFRETI